MSDLMSFDVLVQQHHVQSKAIIYYSAKYVKQKYTVL